MRRSLLLFFGLAPSVVACRPSRSSPPPESGTGGRMLEARPHAAAAAPSASASPSCPADEPEPTPRARPARPRPFVEVIPREDVPVTPSVSPSEVKLGHVACKAKQEVWRDAEGRIRVCTVARRVTLMGIDIAGDAYTHFHQDGRPFQTHTAREHVLSTARGAQLACAPDLVVLSKTGALEHCTLARPAVVGGVPCRVKEAVAFHPGGELAAATVDRATVVAGAELPAGTRVYWYESGRIAGAWLPEPTRVAGVLVRWQIALHENGGLRAFRLAEKRIFQGQELPERAEVELRRDGSLKRAVYEVDRGFMPHGEMWTDTKDARFDCRGRVVHEHVEHWQAEHPPRPRWR